MQKLNQPSVRVATVHKGASFGELALMYTGYRRATVVATTDMVCTDKLLYSTSELLTQLNVGDVRVSFCAMMLAVMGTGPQHI